MTAFKDGIIVHEGKKYRKVDRDVRNGDMVVAVVKSGDVTVGNVYQVREDYIGLYFIDDGGDRRWCPIAWGHVKPIEPVTADLAALESELAATKAKLEELEKQLAEAKRDDNAEKWAKIGRKPGEFKVGDIVKTLDDVGGHPVGTIGILEWDNRLEKLRVRANGELYSHQYELVAPVESVVNLKG
ncbi:hypothetical protein G3578_09870 [Brevibacillus sp. SYP-B805]|uniref:hypothetical protein n=1 Tax=Brevibacillus sp. SYP-B805 TaxID=1578199 RepID=UPI0013EA3C96|nr:hypothetical protein [Brevibacillus sp. SYP-B805]NGQ95460.1 hypothetical protein [Brevibacillus sp. SYP-B805]